MPTLAPEPLTSTQPETFSLPAINEPKDWGKIAAGLASEFRATFVEREYLNQRPLAEIQRYRDTGLVNLLIPKKFGGEGGTVGDAARAILEISKADGSLGFLLSFHFANSNTPRLLDYVTDGEVNRPKIIGSGAMSLGHFTSQPNRNPTEASSFSARSICVPAPRWAMRSGSRESGRTATK